MKTPSLRSFALALSGLVAAAAVLGAGGTGARSSPQTGVPTGPYFKSNKGEMTPVEEKWVTDGHHEKDWLALEFPRFACARSRVAVLEVTNKTATAEGRGNDEKTRVLEIPGITRSENTAAVQVSGLEELLTTALFNTHRFRLIERKALVDLMGEQDAGASGRIDEATATRIGKLAGAEYLVLAAVNDYDPDFKSHKTGGGIFGRVPGADALGAGGLDLHGKAVKVVLSLRVVHATTGEIMLATTVEGTSDSRGVGFAGGGLTSSAIGGVMGRSEKNEPLSYALQICFSKAAYVITNQLKAEPWSGPVVRLVGDMVYIEGSAEDGLDKGMVLDVLAPPQPVLNAAGKKIGEIPGESHGRVEILDVQSQLVTARVVSGGKGIKEKDVARAVR